MPELPEAETIVRGLALVLPGRTVRSVEVLRPDVVRGPPDEFAGAVSGQRIRNVGRRGKNIVLSLDPVRVVVNLGMTGRVLTSGAEHPDARSTHPAVVFHLEDGGCATYDDVRRFGMLSALGPGAWRRWTRALGPEPLGRAFTAARLGEILAASRAPIRSLLLDQRRIAGVGNIYAVEALWAARIDPRTPARLIDPAAVARLHRALRRVLRSAIAAGGTTLRNYRDASGEEGRFGRALRVYGRSAEPCTRCRAPVERIVFGGRSAFRCPRCQPGLPAR